MNSSAEHGQEYETIWKRMGAHRTSDGHAVFRVYAPNAEAVRLTGDFTQWSDGVPMRRMENGVFEILVSGNAVSEGMHYGFRVRGNGGEILKNDPFAFLSQPHSYGSSRFYPFTRNYIWRDAAYMTERRRCRMTDKEQAFPIPMNIYEVHLDSFRPDCRDYRRAAAFLPTYLKKMGYTHLELMPLCEYPYGGSWGYQCLSYFAPTARFGMPEDLMYLVDCMHQAGIGVLLDWVPAHFPKDEKGLYEFDGTPLYEYADWRRAEMPGWGTRCFDLGKQAVRRFLIASALFWLEQYHIDGLRVDAVSAMLYRDYGREAGKWLPDEQGGNVNEDGVSFLRELNDTVHRLHPDVLMIAEESGMWEGVTADTKAGGLGFSYKWNMGFVHDTLSYCSVDPIFRRYHHDSMTKPLRYAFQERYVLSISHDEVVYGKRSLFSKMWGDSAQKAEAFLVYYTFFLTFPGKKLLFMGSEYGQVNEWNWQDFLDLSLLSDRTHARLHDYVRRLNALYLATPALWECDHSPEGFEWLAEERDGNLLAYVRRDRQQGELLCVFCFAGAGEQVLALPSEQTWRIVASTAGMIGQPLEAIPVWQAPFAILAVPSGQKQTEEGEK